MVYRNVNGCNKYANSRPLPDRDETKRQSESPLVGLKASPAFVMRRLRRSKSSEDITTSTPTFPTELVRKLASQKKAKALAVSSASIALSIGSAFGNTCGTPSDGDAGRG